MNEFIERLARDAGVTQRTNPTAMEHRLMQCTKEQLEAFAKAIARECAEIVLQEENTWPAAREIRERFGL